ncbi:MAG: SPASM domain-containing protein [Desulfobacterales bacterium]
MLKLFKTYGIQVGASLDRGPDGRLFPCGQTLADDSFAAGTVWHPEPGALQRLGMSRPEQADCERCEIRDRCPGDCPGRLHYNRGARQTLVCVLYRALLGNINRKPA